MIQFSHLARREGTLLQWMRCRYFRGTTELPCSKRNPGSGHKRRVESNRGQAMLGPNQPGIAVSTKIVLWRRVE